MKQILILICIGFRLLMLWKARILFGYYAGTVRYEHIPLSPGSVQVPEKRTWEKLNRSPLTEQILQKWASRDIPDWQKGGAHRVLLAKLPKGRTWKRQIPIYKIKCPGGKPDPPGGCTRTGTMTLPFWR